MEQTETIPSLHEDGPPKRTLQDKPARKKIKLFDIVALALVVIVIVVLAMTLIGKLTLKHEVSQAKAVSDKVVLALAKQDTTAIRSLGDASFQKKNSASSLNTALTFQPTDSTSAVTFGNLYGDSKPTIAHEIVGNNSRGKHVAMIYRYDKFKVPFFVRVNVGTSGNSSWALQGLSASSNEAAMIGN